jgi:proteic killer suppression protein
MSGKDEDSRSLSLFRDKRTERFAAGERVPQFAAFERQAALKLRTLSEATDIQDLMNLPSNRFESLGGNRRGQYSIRINRQWRICFEWPEEASGPSNIQIVDYHK